MFSLVGELTVVEPAPALAAAAAAGGTDCSDEGVQAIYEVHIEVWEGCDDEWTIMRTLQFGQDLSATQAYFAQLAATREEHSNIQAACDCKV
jgi:hypothetical protein